MFFMKRFLDFDVKLFIFSINSVIAETKHGESITKTL